MGGLYKFPYSGQRCTRLRFRSFSSKLFRSQSFQILEGNKFVVMIGPNIYGDNQTEPAGSRSNLFTFVLPDSLNNLYINAVFASVYTELNTGTGLNQFFFFNSAYEDSVQTIPLFANQSQRMGIVPIPILVNSSQSPTIKVQHHQSLTVDNGIACQIYVYFDRDSRLQFGL